MTLSRDSYRTELANRLEDFVLRAASKNSNAQLATSISVQEASEIISALRSDGPKWRSPLDKPPHLPGEHHSEDVLLAMIDSFERKPVCRIGHISLEHWRPAGGNGNFDEDVLGWMPLPDASDAAQEPK